jgi:hypothetical protein
LLALLDLFDGMLLDAMPCSRIKWTNETDLRLRAGHYMVAFAQGAERSQMEVGIDARALSLSYVSHDKE